MEYTPALLVSALLIILLLVLTRSRAGTERALREEARLAREEQAATARALREELAALQRASADTMIRLMDELRESQGRRLGESFALVSDRLEAVQRGLGEMQSLSSGVGELKRVLSNVKSRGVWGEYQLHAILEQILTPDQYCANYRPRADTASAVEFAVRLPGREAGAPVFLPIDSKFPQEDYQRLQDAADRADPVGLAEATGALVRAVGLSAREIQTRYLHPPATTDFAILFLPTEGLYAEVLRQPGLVHRMQAEHSVIVAGPTTLSAILNSLRMGFRTLAIEQRSGEVWQVLAAVKTEFGRFADVLDRVRRQLGTVSNTLDDTGKRTQAMARRLREVESMPGERAEEVLGLPATGPIVETGEERGPG
jgi:DNA recombination protein RmuC